jgi:predicted MFS family arabinose efflux permease
LMAAYFSGVVAGRVLGSRLAHRYAPSRLLAGALGIALTGFALLWTSSAPVPAALGLAVLGLGLGNTFPMGLALALSLAPDRTGVASARVVTLTSLAVLLAPLSVGTLADATSLKAALSVVPALMALAALGLLAVRRHQPTAMGSLAAQSGRR